MKKYCILYLLLFHETCVAMQQQTQKVAAIYYSQQQTQYPTSPQTPTQQQEIQSEHVITIENLQQQLRDAQQKNTASERALKKEIDGQCGCVVGTAYITCIVSFLVGGYLVALLHVFLKDIIKN